MHCTRGLMPRLLGFRSTQNESWFTGSQASPHTPSPLDGSSKFSTRSKMETNLKITNVRYMACSLKIKKGLMFLTQYRQIEDKLNKLHPGVSKTFRLTSKMAYMNSSQCVGNKRSQIYQYRKYDTFKTKISMASMD